MCITEIKPKNTFYRNEVHYRDDMPTSIFP